MVVSRVGLCAGVVQTLQFGCSKGKSVSVLARPLSRAAPEQG